MTARGRRIGLASACLTSCVVAACAVPPAAPPRTAPPDRLVAMSPIPQRNPAIRNAPVRAVPIATTAELVRRFDRFEGELLGQGLLREDDPGLDALDADRLAMHFLRIALFDEFTPDAQGTFVAQESASRLRRWEAPVELAVRFGASVTPAQRRADLSTVEALAATIAEASGHPVTLADSSGNFSVYVVNETERLALANELRDQIPGLGTPVLRSILDILPSTFCLVVAFSNPEAPFVYVRAVAIIRAEHPQLLRRACFHEEIAQGMGLANDSREVRPSVFNDDEEFALLTAHDQLLLQMLYDARLEPGMGLDEAAPIAGALAAELLPPPEQVTALTVAPEPGDDDDSLLLPADEDRALTQ